VRSIGGTNPTDIADPAVLARGTGNELVIAGVFQGSADFDPGAGAAILTSAGDDDIFVATYDANGDLVWARSAGGTEPDAGQDAAVDSSGRVAVAGRFGDTVDFDPGAGTSDLTASGIGDIFVWTLDSSGNLEWAGSMGSAGDDAALSIAFDADGNLLVAGVHQSSADMDPGPGVAIVPGTGGFIARLDANGDFIDAHPAGSIASQATFDQDGLGIVAGVVNNETQLLRVFTESAPLTSAGVLAVVLAAASILVMLKGWMTNPPRRRRTNG
jgi:hypothetical protein